MGQQPTSTLKLHLYLGTVGSGGSVTYVEYGALEGSLRINATLTARDTASFVLFDASGFVPSVGQPVKISHDDFGDLFGGTIDQVKASNAPGTARVRAECLCVSWDLLLYKRTTTQVYENKPAGDIIQDILANSLGGEGLGSVVVSGPNLTISFDHELAGNAFDAICQAASNDVDTYHWYTTPGKVVHFAKQSTSAAPWSGDADLLIDIAATRTREKYANRVYARLGKYVADAATENFPGDGSSREFSVTYPIAAEPTITLDGAPQTVGVLGVDSGKNWYWNLDSATIQQDAGGTTLTSGNTLSITYQGYATRVVLYQNDGAVDDRAAVEGGTGYYERVIDVATPTTSQQGEALAQAVALRYGSIPVKIEAQTYRGGLKPGQYFPLVVSELDINSTFLIDSVTMSTQGNFVLWSATMIDGALIGDWRTALQSLGSGGGSGAISGIGGGVASAPADTITSITSNATLPTGPQIVVADTSAGDIIATLPHAGNMEGERITLCKVTGAAHTLTVDGNASETIDGALTYILSAQWSSITIEAISATAWKVVAAAVSVSPASPSAPGNVTLGALTFEEIDKGKDGLYLRITQEFTAPSPIGTFQGINVEVEAPDQSTNTQVETLGPTVLGSVQLAGPRKPYTFGPFDYDSSRPRVVVEIPRPTITMTIRVRAISYSDQITNDAAGSPSVTAVYTPSDPGTPAKPNSGTAYADVVTGYSVSARIVVVGGVSYTEIYVQYAPPDDPRFSGIYHVVEYVTADGGLTPNKGVIWRGDEAKPANHFVTPPAQTAKCYALSYSNPEGANTAEDRVNSYVAGITPETTVVLGNPVGPAGTEYADNVTGLTASVVQKIVGGVLRTFITVSFARPADPRWYGAYVGVTYLTDEGDSTTNWGVIQDPAIGPSNSFNTPNSVQSATVQVRSYAVTEGTDKVNTAGPTTTVTIGTSSGTVDFRSAITASFNAAEFHVDPVSLKWSMLNVDFSKGNNFNSSEFEVVTGQFRVKVLSADKLLTGILQVGGGGGKVSILKNFDTSGNLIGWVGDDSGTSGFVGAWFKRLLIGGSSPATAKIVADSAGNVAINGNLLVNGTVASAAIVSLDGAKLIDATVVNAKIVSLDCAKLNAGTITASITMTSPTLIITSGSVRVDINATDYVKVSNSGTSIASQISSSGFILYTTSGAYYQADVTTVGFTISTPSGYGSLRWNQLVLGGNQILTTRQAGPGNTTDTTDVAVRVNNLLTALRAHGLIT